MGDLSLNGLIIYLFVNQDHISKHHMSIITTNHKQPITYQLNIQVTLRKILKRFIANFKDPTPITFI